MIEMNPLVDISEAEYDRFTTFIYENFGINLTDKKRSLVRGRLSKMVRERGFRKFGEFFDAALNDSTGILLIEMVDRISTNHTYFFREPEHFEFIQKEFLPKYSNQEMRIWSAGCATGEEPYTLSMVFDQYLKDHPNCGLSFKILATDISMRALEAAMVGNYVGERVAHVPINLKQRYFDFSAPDSYKVKDHLKKIITFKRFNLMEDTFPFNKQFHLILCRNVMIYFDKVTRDTLVSKYFKHLAPEGYFLIGHSETLNRDNMQFKYLSPSVYRK